MTKVKIDVRDFLYNAHLTLAQQYRVETEQEHTLSLTSRCVVHSNVYGLVNIH